MSALAHEPPLDAFELSEAVAASPAGPFFDHDVYGRVVPLHIIRPGIGRGKGKHLYEAAMLERNSKVFTGWRMYVDHLSDAAKRALGGLPRSVSQLGGIIKESYWDPTVPADPARGFGQGAVVGLAKATPLIRELIETDPDLVEASIAASATGVRAVQHGNQQVWLVEGIAPRGSVDWVTEAGAGGRVARLVEATREEMLQESRDIESELLDALDNEGLAEYLRASGRHALAEALLKTTEEDEVEITPEVLQEALQTDEAKALIAAQVAEGVTAALSGEALQTAIQEGARALIQEERELLRVDAKADADRTLQLRDLRDFAFGRIEEAKLPEAFKTKLKGEFELSETGPAAKLDVIDEIDGEGNVVKTAKDILKESVDAALDEARELLASARPTVVRGQGPSVLSEQEKPAEGGSGDEKKPTTGSGETDEFLQEAGFQGEELDGMYDGIFTLSGVGR